MFINRRYGFYDFESSTFHNHILMIIQLGKLNHILNNDKIPKFLGQKWQISGFF